MARRALETDWMCFIFLNHSVISGWATTRRRRGSNFYTFCAICAAWCTILLSFIWISSRRTHLRARISAWASISTWTISTDYSISKSKLTGTTFNWGHWWVIAWVPSWTRLTFTETLTICICTWWTGQFFSLFWIWAIVACLTKWTSSSRLIPPCANLTL